MAWRTVSDAHVLQARVDGQAHHQVGGVLAGDAHGLGAVA
jgi:hypothetical protein